MAVDFLRRGVRREGGDVDTVVPAADRSLTPCPAAGPRFLQRVPFLRALRHSAVEIKRVDAKITGLSGDRLEIDDDFSESDTRSLVKRSVFGDDRFGGIYNKYKNLREKKIEFIGRCGTYQYLDMHQVVNQSLLNVNRWIKDHE